jgi:uncharacterized protein
MPDLARRILRSPPAQAVQHTIALAVAGFALYIGFARFVEQRAASELAVAGMGRQLGIGLLIGAGLYTACELVLMALGIVSGNEASQGLVWSTVQGPDLLTGGNFGVESSVLALPLCTATGVVMLVMAVRRGKIVPPAWKRAA